MICVHLFIVFISFGFVQNSVIRQEGEQAQSLYDINDKVFVLTHENFYQAIYDQPYASIVEFYNSFCGFCRYFAPIYKAWAAEVYGWRDVVRVSAIDCADDANNDVCRDMEIMRYPTLKFFPPFSRNETDHLGIEVQHEPMTVGEPHLIALLANVSSAPSSWPNLQPISATYGVFAGVPSTVEYVFMVLDSKNDSIIAPRVALDLKDLKNFAQIRQVNETDAQQLGLTIPSAVYVGVRSLNHVELVKQIPKLNPTLVRTAIEEFLKSKGVQINQFQNISNISPNLKTQISPTSEKSLAVIEYVKKNPGLVFQADLELAIRFAVFHELTKYNNMNEDQIAALKHFLRALERYSPLGDNGQRFLSDLNVYVNSETQLNGKTLSNKMKELEKIHHPVFSSSKWIGCKPSIPGRRGYSCGLWQLFHYLTVQASNSDRSHDPLEILQAIHGFVKYYFGCTHCSRHFQEMSERNHIWQVATKEEAVLWLWTAHNEVNQRLAGDATEDPAFPKIQYPSQQACPECYQKIVAPTTASIVLHWQPSEVLYYLRRVYSLYNISRYGVDDEAILPQMLSSVYASKLNNPNNTGYAGAFSEIDIRMGMLLYAFCMLIIVVAVKLFLQRGYRKKIYTHDFLGKL